MTARDERQEPVSDDFDDDIHEVPSHTPDFRTELAEDLSRLVPEAVADGKIDVEKLRELLSEDVADDGREGFGLVWPGKSRALKAAQAPTTATLVPDREASKDWDTTGNVFIEGDNLEVLKILQKHYHGKIKMIYIDPPYNTGNDFIYPDNFKEGLQTYLEWTKQVSEDGKKLSSNPESAGRYHSNWLNMMYPRLKLAKNLLTEDGAIFVSIGEAESGNLLKMCAEVFGDANVEEIIWHKVADEGAAGQGKMKVTNRFRKDHETVLVAYREKQKAFFNKPLRKRALKNAQGNPDNDHRGPWLSANMSKAEAKSISHGKNFFSVTSPTGTVFTRQWHFSAEEFAELDADGRIYWGGGNSVPRLKKFVDEPTRVTPNSVVKGHSQTDGNKDFSKLFAGLQLFENPKPVGLLSWLIEIGADPGSLILDFFSGSSSTAHAVMQLNAEDGGSRRHIQVQLPEPVDPESEAGQAGFGTIADIARERIRRAGEKIKEDFSEQLAGRETPLDVGFRSYKLSDTSFVKWRETSAVERNALEQRLAGLRGSADDDATPEMLLTELLLKQGYSLTESVSEVEIAGLKVWSVADGALLAVMDEHVKPSLEQLRAVVEAGAVRLVILEDVLAADDQLKTNLVQHAKTHGVELWSA
jgi:adenine-specific DNA-methyltransferase